ncbi:signal recognition particle-docking protein FtsY [Nocardia concava]|uniref:signal recognition particle-docking protein FtsY n=1 Tax=Nocardia concava TaxID=257281 RepID=UPI00030428FC|nr:signal recognition particle-docking protein FtsY [Nocardia concava]
MTTAEVWILIAAIAAVLLVALVAGYALNKRRRISLTPEVTETKEVTDRSGGYQASSGFSFSQGSATEREKVPATKPKPKPLPPERTDDEGQPHIGDDAAVPRDAAKRSITNVPLPDPVQGPEPAQTDEAAASVTPTESTAAQGDQAASAAGKTIPDAAGKTTSGTHAQAGTAATDNAAPSESASPAATSVPGDAAAGAARDESGSTTSASVAENATSPAGAQQSTTPTASEARVEAVEAAGQAGESAADRGAGEVAEQPVSEEAAAEEAAEAAVAAAEVAAGAEAAVKARAGAPTVASETAAAAPAIAEIEPTSGRLTRLRGRLSRSQNAVGKSLLGLLGGGDLDEESWEEIEDTLVMADLGTASTAVIVDRLREEMAARTVRTAAEARALLRGVLIEALRPELDRSIRALPHDDHPSILLVVGVNGTGKTTTTGKLARVLVADGRRVLLGAADTFRAAAADQLQTWGERVGAETVRGKEGADPAAVAFDAVSAGIDRGVDVVLIDTAGRLHTKTGLMDELGKVKRVVEKKAAVDEVILVLDSTVGQNGLMQARVFADVVDITGVALTKLDGTAKGGIVFQVQHELGVPVKLVGLGEGADDLAPFEPGAFVDALLG